MWQCNGQENTCGPAADAGVSLLHGCGEEFVKVPSPAAMFHALAIVIEKVPSEGS